MTVLLFKGAVRSSAVRSATAACVGSADAADGARRARGLLEHRVRVRGSGGRPPGAHGEGARGRARRRAERHRVRARARHGAVRRAHDA